MNVSLKHHRRVVVAFAVGFAILTGLLLLAIFDVGVFEYKRAPAEEPLTATSSNGDLTAPDSPFLQEEEVVVLEPKDESGEETVLPVEKVLFEYVEVVNSCGPHFEGECLNARLGPGTEFDIARQLRNEVVLKVGGQVERDGEVWYKIVFDEWLRYPERLEGEWYVSSDYVEVLRDEGERTVWEHGSATTSKRILIDRSDQRLYAYNEDGGLYMQTPISTGLALTPTPRGTFTVFKKTPSRYMQGPLPGLPSDQYYDMPGVPWNLYFTEGGAVIHGAYWHESFGRAYSHGCVNLPPDAARELYNWAVLGTKVIVED